MIAGVGAGAGGVIVAGDSVVASTGCLGFEARPLDGVQPLRRKRHTVLGSGGIVDDKRSAGCVLGHRREIKDRNRSDFTHDRRRHVLMGGSNDGRFIQIVAVKVRIHFPQNRLYFQKRRDTAAGSLHTKARIETVTENPGVAQSVAGGEYGGVGHRDGRE